MTLCESRGWRELRARFALVLIWGFPLGLLATWMLTGQTRTVVLRWWFLSGFAFLVSVGAWAVVTITRMQREQVIAIAMLRALAARDGLKDAIDHLKADDAG